MIQLSDVADMDRPALLRTWKDVFGTCPPKGLSQNMLRRFLAFELQVKQHGGLSKQAKAALAGSNSKMAKAATPALKPGGRLIREWNGTTHIVDVTDDGFLWRGESWRSLSAIAREITGAHWSGPRFFGLAKTP